MYLFSYSSTFQSSMHAEISFLQIIFIHFFSFVLFLFLFIFYSKNIHKERKSLLKSRARWYQGAHVVLDVMLTTYVMCIGTGANLCWFLCLLQCVYNFAVAVPLPYILPVQKSSFFAKFCRWFDHAITTWTFCWIYVMGFCCRFFFFFFLSVLSWTRASKL